MKWINTNKRFIAYIDIMGFKEFVFRNSHQAVLKKMELLRNTVAVIEEGEKAKQKKKFFTGTPEDVFDIDNVLVKMLSFSDSVLMCTNDDSQASISNLLLASGYFMYACLMDGIPVKGALSHGTLTIDFDQSIYFGKPLIDAYLLENEINLYGLALDHNVEKYLKEKKILNHEAISCLITHYKTPLKGSKVFHYNVDWLFGFDQKKHSEIKDKMLNLYNTVSGPTRKYVDNTMDFLEYNIKEKYSTPIKK